MMRMKTMKMTGHDIHLGEEDGTIEFEDLDKKEEQEVIPEPEAEKEVDPLAEIEGKANGSSADTLVLKL